MIQKLAFAILTSLLLPIAHATSLDDLKNTMIEQENAERKAAIEKAKYGGSNPGAVAGNSGTQGSSAFTSVSRSSEKNIVLVNILGVGNALKGDFLINGAPITLSAGDVALGWKLVSITSYEAKLQQDKKGSKKTVIVAIEARSPLTAPMEGISSASGSLPPVPQPR